jgi:hypothetical protein
MRQSFRDGAQHQTADAQLRIGEARDSGFDASHRPPKDGYGSGVSVRRTIVEGSSARKGTSVAAPRSGGCLKSGRGVHAPDFG